MTSEIQQIHKGCITLSDVQEKIIALRNAKVILDSDVALLYGVETKEVNQAVKNNPKKFPKGYIIELKKSELYDVRSKFLTTSLEKTRALPKGFTEKGLYMLATILKGEKAADTTIAIVEAFAKIRELSHSVAELVKAPNDAQKQALVVQKSSEVLSDIVDRELRMTGTETTFEMNLLSAIKIKHTIKREVK